MTEKEFKRSRWMQAAKDPRIRRAVLEEFPEWLKESLPPGLVRRAARLWKYLWSGKCSAGDVAIVLAALLYLMSPLDAVPDVIPLSGWLDDVAVATLVLGYLDKKAAAVLDPDGV
jgi:hypothetical protein